MLIGIQRPGPAGSHLRADAHGEGVGDSMYEGTIYVGGEIASLGSDAKTEEISEDEVIDILAALENHGITKRYTFTKVVSAKRLYNYDSLERLEKAII